MATYQDDIHYATDNGSTITYTFVGTGIQGGTGELSTDQGHFSAALDGGAPRQASTPVPSDGQRHSDGREPGRRKA